MTHRVVSDNAPRLEASSHHLPHQVQAPMVFLLMAWRRQWLWTGRSNASRVRGATRLLLGTALGQAGRRLDHVAGAGSQCVRRVARIWLYQVSAASLVPLRWAHRCSLPWARWRLLHQGHKSALASGDGNKRRTCRFGFARVCSSNHFHSAGLPYFFHILYVLPTSASVINNQSVDLSNMLLVFTVRVLSLFAFSARISIRFVSPRCCTLPIEDVKRFFVHHCCRDLFFSLLNIYSLSQLEESFSIHSCLSTHLWQAKKPRVGKRGEFFSIPSPSLSCSFPFSF
jgi:hypothetical protein